MLGIKNFDLIVEHIHNFSLIDLRYIVDFRYHIDFNNELLRDESNISSIDTTFITVKDNEVYRIVMKFKHIRDCEVSFSGTVVQLSKFEILDIEDDGWEQLKYLVRDFENEELHFYCNEIEVISVMKMELFID